MLKNSTKKYAIIIVDVDGGAFRNNWPFPAYFLLFIRAIKIVFSLFWPLKLLTA
jgi:hypothetical protein